MGPAMEGNGSGKGGFINNDEIKINRDWTKKPKENLSYEEIFKEVQAQHLRNMQERAMNYLLCFYGFVLVCTMAIIFLQGFKAWGFQLPPEFLKWLGGATVGEVGGLAALVYGFFFRKRQ